MSAYVQDTQFFTRRTVVFAAIIALHIFLIWVLATGLASRAIQMVAPPIKTTIVQQTKTQVKPPPPPPPQLQQQQVQVPPPVVNINVPAAEQTHAITVQKKVVRAAPPPAPPAHITPLRAIARDFPSTDDYYPDASRRLGEQGTALVKLCIGAGGRVIGDPSIEKSSGSSRLDQAAIRYAKATSGHFSPETKNGEPVTVCTALPIKFQLTDSF